MGDCCDYCETEHTFDVVLGDQVVLFSDSDCHYLETTCPHCGIASRLYSQDWWDLLAEVLFGGLRLMLVEQTDDEARQGSANAHTKESVDQKITRDLEELFTREQAALPPPKEEP